MGQVRSRVRFHEVLGTWVMEVPNGEDAEGENEHVSLKYLVQHGVPDSIRKELRHSLKVTDAEGRPALTRDSKYMISGRFNTQERFSNCKALKAALEEIGFSHILLVNATGGDQFGPLTMQYL